MTERDTYALAAFVGVVVAVCATSLIVSRRRLRVPAPLVLLVVFTLAYGWAFTLNGRPEPNFDDRVPRGHLIDWLPGAIDRRDSAAVMVPLTAVLLLGLVLIDRARDAPFRQILLGAITASGAAMAVVAVVARGTAWSWPFTGAADPSQGGRRFASFGYHGNSAAFLELALSAALLLAALELPRPISLLRRAAVVAAPAVILAGVATNVSKLGHALGLVIVAAFCVFARRDRGSARRTFTRRSLLGLAAIALVVVAAGAFVSRDRWRELPEGVSSDSGRVLTWEVAAEAAQRSPLVGSGPGSFKLLLPVVATEQTPDLYRHWIVSRYESGEPVTIWMHAHQDPLQTLVEWGAIAGSALAVMVLWPLAAALRTTTRTHGRSIVPAMASVALGTVYFHALVDFPLQVLGIQITVAAWAAIAIGGSSDPEDAADSDPLVGEALRA